MPKDFNPVKQITVKTLPKMIKRHLTSLIIALAILVALGLVYTMMRARRRIH